MYAALGSCVRSGHLGTPVSTATYPSVTKARAFYSPSHGFRTGLLWRGTLNTTLSSPGPFKTKTHFTVGNYPNLDCINNKHKKPTLNSPSGHFSDQSKIFNFLSTSKVFSVPHFTPPLMPMTNTGAQTLKEMVYIVNYPKSKTTVHNHDLSYW